MEFKTSLRVAALCCAVTVLAYPVVSQERYPLPADCPESIRDVPEYREWLHEADLGKNGVLGNTLPMLIMGKPFIQINTYYRGHWRTYAESHEICHGLYLLRTGNALWPGHNVNY